MTLPLITLFFFLIIFLPTYYAVGDLNKTPNEEIDGSRSGWWFKITFLPVIGSWMWFAFGKIKDH